MKVTTTLLSQALLASYAAAFPRGIDRRSGRHTHTMIPGVKPSGFQPSGHFNGSYADDYSSNWSGAVYTAPPSGSTFNSVAGTFTVPQPSPPSGSGDGTWEGCAWVGIDGDTYSAAILQAGVDWSVSSSGGQLSYGYSTWIEWYPDAQVNVDFEVNAGDVVTVTCTATSSSEGTVVIENQTSGQSTTQYISAPSSSSNLGGQNAEWIVEDFSSGGSLVPFANFGSVDFSNCVAGTTNGNVDASGATVFDITDSSGNVIAQGGIPDGSDVSSTYQ